MRKSVSEFLNLTVRREEFFEKIFAPTYLSNNFSKNSLRRTVKLRSSETDLRIPLYKTSNGQKSFSYRGVHLWNSLEPEVKQAPSLYAFKHRL